MFEDNELCYNNALITLLGNPFNNQLAYRYNYIGEIFMVDHCPFSNPNLIPIPIPTTNMNLIKQ